jgi:hypothetical protein
MNRTARLLALLPPLLLAACATSQGLPLPMSTPSGPKAIEFVATGEFRSSIGESAAFDEWRVVGPLVNLARKADGSWDGTAGPKQSGVHFDVKPGALMGPTLSLGIQKTADGYIEVGGLYFGERVAIRISPRKLTGATHDGRCSFEFDRVSPTQFGGDVACGTNVTRTYIELLGVAARVEDPVLPQAALALLAVMP